MKFLVMTDIHGNSSVLDKLDDEFKSCDAVLFGGDFADVISKLPGEPVLEKLCSKHDEIYAALGNHDVPDFLEQLEDSGINAERTLNYTDGIAILGSGGATEFTHDTPNERPEDDIIKDFDILNSASGGDEKDTWRNLIIISHNPPKDTKCDAVNDTLHAGSQKFRELIEQIQPLAVVTGHIHEGTSIDKIGRTTVINSGSLGNQGTYAVLEIEKNDGEFIVKNAEIKKI